MHTSWWISQKIPTEIVQKGLILSQKRLISNRTNFSLLATKSMHFPLKDRKLEDSSSRMHTFFTSDFFLFTKRAFEFCT